MFQVPLARWPMMSVGAALIFTAVFAWCPLYYSVGWSTHSSR